MFTLKPTIVRPNVRVQAKKNDFVEPAEALGEGEASPTKRGRKQGGNASPKEVHHGKI